MAQSHSPSALAARPDHSIRYDIGLAPQPYIINGLFPPHAEHLVPTIHAQIAHGRDHQHTRLPPVEYVEALAHLESSEEFFARRPLLIRPSFRDELASVPQGVSQFEQGSREESATIRSWVDWDRYLLHTPLSIPASPNAVMAPATPKQKRVAVPTIAELLQSKATAALEELDGGISSRESLRPSRRSLSEQVAYGPDRQEPGSGERANVSTVQSVAPMDEATELRAMVWEMTIPQQPAGARKSSRLDRRPIDPPPIIKVRPISPSTGEVVQIPPYTRLTVYCNLLLDDGTQLTESRDTQRILVGKDSCGSFETTDAFPHGRAHWSVFDDLGCSSEGKFRLLFRLFVSNLPNVSSSGGWAVGGRSWEVARAVSDEVDVRMAANFSGMTVSSELLKELARAGLGTRVSHAAPRKRALESMLSANEQTYEALEEGEASSSAGHHRSKRKKTGG